MRILSAIVSFLLVFLCFLTVSAAEKQTIYFRHLGVTEGLTNNCISSIVQDRRGNLWIGTKDGLNRFDGNNVKTYKNQHGLYGGLPNNAVTALLVDKSGKLWVGTSNGLSEYLSREDKFVPVPGIEGHIYCLSEGTDGKIWVAIGENSTIACLNSTSKQVKLFNLEESVIGGNSAFHSIAIEESGSMWIGTFGEGLFFSKDSLNTIVPYSDSRTGTCPYDNDRINFLKIFDDGYLYVGSYQNGAKVIAIENHNLSDVLLKDEQGKPLICRSILKTQEGKLLIGGETGLQLIDGKDITHMTRLYTDNNSLSDNAIYSLFQDTYGGIWVGSYFGGVDYSLSPFSLFSRYQPTSKDSKLMGKRIGELCEDDYGIIWIGTDDAGLNSFDPKTKQFSYFEPSIEFTNINGLCMVDGMLWVGTYANGIKVVNPKTRQLVKSYVKGENSSNLVDDIIFSIIKSDDGEVYIGTPLGIQKYDKQKDCFTLFGPPYFAYFLKIDSRSNLWAGSFYDGLFKINRETGEYINYRTPDLPSNEIRYVFEDSERSLWFLTGGGGFCQYDESTDTFIPYNTSNGYPCDIALRMEESSDGTLWISTTVGLISFRKTTGEYRLFTVEDGLPSNQFNYQSSFKSKDGTLYFGSIEGLVSFYPSRLPEKKIIPSPYISDIKVGGKQIPVNESGIVLKPGHEIISINTALPSLHKTWSWKIEYKMNGIDAKWNPLEQFQVINYDNLAPGNYSFSIRAISSTFGEEVVETLSITILPYWYQTIWAILLFVALLCLSVYFAVRIVKWKNYNQYQFRLAEMRRASEENLYESKLSFYTDVAHEIKTPVTLIIGPLEDIMKKKISDKEIVEDLQLIKKNSNKLTDLINQLLDFRKVEKSGYKLHLSRFNISPIIENIAKSFSFQAKENGIKISVSLPDNDVIADIDQDLFCKIISNIVSNGIKYSSSFLNIILGYDTGSEFFTITSINDGDVIPDDMREDIFKPFVRYHKSDTKNVYGTGIGLILARKLAELHGGSLKMKDSEKNNVFVLSMPVKQNTTASIDNDQSYVTEAAANLSDTSILVVEDNIDMLTFIKRQLCKEHMVFEARNGKEALSVLESQDITIVISDYMMPVMNGIDLCKAIKSDIKYSHIPFILFTANNSDSAKIEALSSGVDSYIEKPFNIEYLKASILSICQNRENLKRLYSQKSLETVSQMAANDAEKQFLEQLNSIIAENYSNPDFRLEDIGDMMNMSKSNFYRKIKGVMDMTPNDLLRFERLKKAAELLQQKKYRINEVCYMVGFNSPSYFDRCFQKHFGLTPKEYISRD